MSSKITLVTGAAHGIGRSITDLLLSKGDVVIPTDVNSKELFNFQKHENAFPIPMDVTNEKNILNAVDQVKNTFNRIDCIINNAGIFFGGPLVEIELGDFEEIFNINVLGYVRVTKLFFPLLHKESRIVNISSEVGRIAYPFNGPYTMTKYAIEAFSDALRRELTYLGMKTIVIQPGSIKTQISEETIKCYKKYCENSQFEDQITRVRNVLIKEGYADPGLVANVVYKAIHCKHPRNRYKVENNRARRILEYLPNRWVDFIIKKVM